MKSQTILALTAFLGLAACGADDSPPANADAAPDETFDAAGAEPDAAPLVETESEPNDGSTLTEFNAITVGATVQGAIGSAGDSDVFRFDATPGALYALTLRAAGASPLDVHLTAMDAGRDGASAGGDYVKIDSPPSGGAELEVLAMGEGGYFAIVRDARNVGGAGGEGGPEYTYELVVTRVEEPEISELSFPSTVNGTLASPGSVALYRFDGTQGTDFRIDMQATGDADGRLILFSEATGDWIARNDDRGGGDTNPLLDAFLTASGAMILAVENIDPEAASLGFSLASSNP